MTAEETIHPLVQLEQNRCVRDCIEALNPRELNLTRLSDRQILSLENETEITIYYTGLHPQKEIPKQKRKTLCRFVNKRPYLPIDSNKPYEDILRFLLIYSQAPREPNKKLIIDINGEFAFE